MTSNPLPWSSSRLEGCTLTGALSVTTEVTDGVTIIHGPAGCSQHNASLIHATLLDHDTPHLLRILSSDLDEAGVIFGGEGALAACIREAAEGDPSAIFVLSTCVVQTIGDDVGGVCRRGWGVPVIPIPSSGFLGGGFQDGMRNALIAIGDLAGDAGDRGGGITLVGEKNLEHDVEENFREISHLLALLGEKTSLRFIRGMEGAAIQGLSRSRLNILRERGSGLLESPSPPGSEPRSSIRSPSDYRDPSGSLRRRQGSWGWIPQQPLRRSVLVRWMHSQASKT